MTRAESRVGWGGVWWGGDECWRLPPGNVRSNLMTQTHINTNNCWRTASAHHGNEGKNVFYTRYFQQTVKRRRSCDPARHHVGDYHLGGWSTPGCPWEEVASELEGLDWSSKIGERRVLSAHVHVHAQLMSSTQRLYLVTRRMTGCIDETKAVLQIYPATEIALPLKVFAFFRHNIKDLKCWIL